MEGMLIVGLIGNIFILITAVMLYETVRNNDGHDERNRKNLENSKMLKQVKVWAIVWSAIWLVPPFFSIWINGVLG